MDEEYDVIHPRDLIPRVTDIRPGHRSRHWPDGVYPVGSALGRGKEGPSHG
jgi:hypothetical protein